MLKPAIALLLVALAVLAPRAAAAQTVAIHQPALVSPTNPTPAKATASAIIPGSPLAALTGAAPAPADVDANTPTPFGTSNLGLSITTTIGRDASSTIDDFVRAIQQSTRLDPVFAWARSVADLPVRRAHAIDIVKGIAITIVPALLVETAIGLGLARPRARIAAGAARREAHAEPPPAPAPLTPPTEDDPADAKIVEPEGAPPDDPQIAEEDVEGISAAEAGEIERRPRRRESLLAWARRLAFAALYLGLSLVPLIGFIIALQALVSAGLLATREAQRAVIGVANAYLFCRLVLEALRFLVAPKAPPLRLIRMNDRRAKWLNRWLRILLATAAAGYVVFSVGEVLGLSRDGALPLVRLIALAVHVEIAIGIWQSRHVVAHWIAGKTDPDSYTAGFRHRLASIWHFIALFYVLALWIAYAAGIHNAFGLLLRVVLVVIAALLLGRLAWTGSSNFLERLFPDPNGATARHPALYARARAYNPLIRLLIRIIIAVLMVVGVLQGWGVNAFGWLLSNPFSRSLISAFVDIVITIAVALILWEASNAWINARIEGLTAAGRTRQASRLRTLLPMLKASIGVSIFLVAGLICLSKIGVNAAPLLAGAGVVGIAIGFGSQKLVQDIITGLFLLLEDAMQVGDVITLAGMSGTVERLSIRTIRLRGGDGSVNIIPFSAVTTVTNQTRDFGYAQISIEVGYEEDLNHVYAVLADIAKTMRAEPKWGLMMKDDLQIFGLDSFGASALVITGQIRTGPGQHWAVRREFNARVKRRFEEEHIEMPYTYLPPAPPKVLETPPPAADATRLATEPEQPDRS
jgi:small conductance mechanosensitive channel